MSPILLDSIILILILLSAIFAYFRGFVKEVLTIVNLGGAAAAAYLLGPSLRPFFNEQFGVPAEGADEKTVAAAKIWGVVPPELMSAFASYACVFFGVYLILTLAGFYIAGSVKALGLGPADKFLGVLFGAARGFLIVFLFYIPIGFSMSPEKLPKWAKESVSVQVLQDSYEWADQYMNEEKRELAESDEKIDPDSIKGRLKRAADNMSHKKDEMQEKAQEEYQDARKELRETGQDMREGAQNVTDEILTDSERHLNP